MLNITHSSATPEGMKVKAYAEVTEVNGREITFRVWAEDEAGLIKTKKASGRGSYRSGRLINLSKPTNPPVNKTTVKDRTAA